MKFYNLSYNSSGENMAIALAVIIIMHLPKRHNA